MSKILNLIRPVLGTDGNVTYTSLCKFPINSGAKKKFTLGKEDYIKVSFSTHDELSLNIGDGIDDDDIGVYKLKKRYKPTYDESTHSYKYDLQFDSYYMLWANILMVYNPSVAAGELSFGLTGRLELHSELLKSNLKANGFQYRGLDFVVAIDSANVKNEAKLVECDGTDIISYLNTLCDKDHFNCEWWVVKNIIYFGKCEYDNTTNDGYYNDVEFEIGKNCSSMKANETQDEFANRVYVFGGTNNITGRYRKKLIYKVSDVVDYNSTQKIIKDSSRPLFAYYFKSQEKTNKSYSVTNSVGYNVMPKSVQGNDFHVTFDFNSFPCGGLIDFSGIKCGIQLFDANNNVVAPSSTFNYTLDIYVVGQKNSVPVTINHITQTGAIADLLALIDTISISDADCKGFAFPYISFNFTTDIDASTYTNIKRAVWNFSGNAVFSLNSPVINTKLSYNGSLYDVVINHDNSSSTDMNILLPAGLSIPVLGEYTLPNIITGKVPSSKFTAAEGETNNDLVYQGTVQKRLMLPIGTPYIQTDKNLTPEQIKIAILTYDDIYPRFNCQKITSVSSVDHEEKVDGDVTAKYPLYTIGDKNLVFDKNCLLDNSPQIIFQTGLLAGNALSLTYLGTINGESQFRIEHDEKLDLPNKVLMPSVGDEYILNNIDTSYYFADGAGTLEDKAEQELLEEGEKDAKDILNLEDTFDCSMISNVMKKDNISYQIGQKVTLRNNNYFATGTRDSRVIGYEVCLDKPYDKPVYSIGNSVKYSLVADLENKIDKLKFNGGTYYGVSGGSNSSSYSIYVVNKSDTTKLSDVNVMSSLRTIQELDDRALSKQHDDVAKGVVDFQKGIKLNGNAITDIVKSSDAVQDTDTLIMSAAKALATMMRKDIDERTENSLSIGKDITVDGQAILNDVVANTGTFAGLLKAASATITGALLASTVNATTINANTFIGELQGNAATATKLKTARTIWGQSFDGSGNVDGRFSLGGDTFTIEAMSTYKKIQTWNNTPLSINPSGNNLGIGTTTPQYKLDVNGNARIASDLYADATVGTRNFASRTTGWNVNAQGAADFRNIYADELRVQAFTADISQALAGSDYLTKSVSKLSANFVVPSVNSTVRIIVDDIEGMPATRCFSNNDYIRFRAFNRTSGLTIANVWGTVVLDTTYGTNGFLNGTQAYTFTCKATSGAGLTVFKGSEVLDYGTSGSGMISRTTLDAQGSPYEQIATWVNDPSVGSNYTVHARLGNLGGIANCNGYGIYTDNGFFTGKIVIGDLTKNANFLSFDGVNGLQIKLGGTSVATTTDINAIQIGGRNLLRKSYLYTNRATYNSTTHTWSGVITATGDSYWRFDLYNLIAEKYVGKLTVSFVANSTINGQMQVAPSWNNGQYVNLTSVDTYYSLTFDADFLNYSYWGRFLFSNVLRGATVQIKDIMIEKSTKASAWSPAPEDIDASVTAAQNTANTALSNAASAQNSANSANTAIANIVSDNILSANEKGGERDRWNVIASEKSGIDTQSTTYGITTEKTAYDTAFQSLATYLNNGTTWTSGIPNWITDANLSVDTTVVGTTYRSKWQGYFDAKTALLNAIYVKAKVLADNAQGSANTAIGNAATAQTTATNAATAATNAQTSANTANSAISDMTSDDKITAQEKQAMKTEWDSIVSEKTKNDTQADAFSVSRTTYDSAYSTLSTTIGANLSNLTTTWDLGSGGGTTLRAQFNAYYDARTDLLNAVSTKAKDLANSAVSTAASNAAALYVTQSTYNSYVTVTNQAIQAKVSQTDFNALGTRVGSAESTITQHSTDIASKVSQTTFDALGTRVSTAESTITQHTTDIGLRVTKDGVIGAINLTSEDATIAARKINLIGAVTIGALDSSVTATALGGATPKDVSTAVNNIQIGGRNLIRNGDFSNGKAIFNSNGYTSFQQITTDLPNGFISGGKFVVPEYYRGFYYGIGFSAFENGKAYTLSYYAKVSSPCQMDAGLENLNAQRKDLTTSWQQFSTTIVGDGKNHAVIFYPTSACELYITGIQLKKSTKVEDWTPAPEDVAQDVTNKVNALSAAHGGFTFLDNNSIYTGTLTAGQVNAVGINANSITTGTLSTDRINSVDVVAKGLVAQMVQAATLQTIHNSGEAYIDIHQGIMDVYGTVARNIQFGVNDQGMAVLKYFDNDGINLYDLGPDGLDTKNLQDAQWQEIKYVRVLDINGMTTVPVDGLVSDEDALRLFRLNTAWKETTLYIYHAGKINNTIVSDSANGFTTAADAAAANGKFFTDKHAGNLANDTYTENNESHMATDIEVIKEYMVIQNGVSTTYFWRCSLDTFNMINGNY